MRPQLRTAVASGLMIALTATGPASAQKQGGIVRFPILDSPASMSVHEESAVATERAMMGIFNNLVIFDQHVPQTSEQSIVPDLATSWSWSEDGTVLTLPLRQGVEWHDGKPSTAADVKCTWDILAGKSGEKLRANPRKSWYNNLSEVTTNGDYEVVFHLKRRQPSFIALLASGWSPVYPCHVSLRDMRNHPIGTGPFKFVEFKPNEGIWGMPPEMLRTLPGYGPDVHGAANVPLSLGDDFDEGFAIQAQCQRPAQIRVVEWCRLTIRLRAALSGSKSQIACGAWFFTSFRRGGCRVIRSNFPVMNPNIRVDTLGIITCSIASRYGRSFFQ